MDVLTLIGLQNLMHISRGHSNITIGLIDGPVNLSHTAFEESTIKSVNDYQMIKCRSEEDIACIHGTFIAGILSAKRGLSAPAICPRCTLLLRPIFSEGTSKNNHANVEEKFNQNEEIYFPSTNPKELSNAIVEVVNNGANIINLSLGLSNSSLTLYKELQESYDYARKKGVIIVAATGNLGNIGGLSLIDHDWIIPVAACDEYGRLHPMSNIGPSIGIRGLLAPGVNITSTFPSNEVGYNQMSGTSFAAPFVTGAIALLWSVFPDASAAQIVQSIRNRDPSNNHNRSIIPPLMNVEAAFRTLQQITLK